MRDKYKFGTICLYGGRPNNLRSHNVPIERSASWEVRNDKEFNDSLSGSIPLYARFSSSATVQYVERKICAMETLTMDGGRADARLRADGMNAVAMVFYGALRIPGDHAIIIGPVYGGTYDLINDLKRLGFRFTFLVAKDPDLVLKVPESITRKTRLIHGEITTNPTLDLWDVRAISKIAKSIEEQPILSVDSSFTSPYNFRPFEHGADVIVHSATKYLGAHGAFTAGLVVVSEETLVQFPDFWKNANEWANHHGGTPNDFMASDLGLSMEDLHIRVPIQNSNAEQVAFFLKNHPKISQVYYPKLGGMVSFRIKGNLKTVKQLLYKLNDATIIKYKPSLGYTKTIVESPWILSQMSLTPEHRELFGITEDLVRLSCGIEPIKDILNALEKGLGSI